MELGALGLIPVVVLIVVAVITRKTASSLLLGIALCWIIMEGVGFLTPMIDLAYEVGGDEDTVWLFLLFGLLFAFMGMLEEIGCTRAFVRIVQKKAKTARSTMFWTWLVSVALFIDETLSLAVLGTLSPLYDKHKIPRATLAYIGDSTAAPIVTLVPFTAWGVFYAGVFSGYDDIVALGKSPFDFYVSLIPFLFYAWIAIVIVFLFVMGVIPPLGAMKKAYKKAEQTGQLYSEASNRYNLHAADDIAALDMDETDAEKKSSMIRLVIFLVCLITLTIGVIITHDLLIMTIIAMIILSIAALVTRIASWTSLTNAAIEGLAKAVPVLVIVFCAYMMRDSLIIMELPAWVISIAEPYISPSLLPVISFVLCCILTFTTGSNWGITAVYATIGVPLCFAIGADPVLSCASIVAGATFGGHVCFYADYTVQSSILTKIDNMEHALTQLPYGIIGGAISAVCFLIAGFVVG